jgi:hypothetical protein
LPGYAREINASLALVTPCYLLNELLHTKKAKEQRERIITENMKSRE